MTGSRRRPCLSIWPSASTSGCSSTLLIFQGGRRTLIIRLAIPGCLLNKCSKSLTRHLAVRVTLHGRLSGRESETFWVLERVTYPNISISTKLLADARGAANSLLGTNSYLPGRAAARVLHAIQAACATVRTRETAG